MSKNATMALSQGLLKRVGIGAATGAAAGAITTGKDGDISNNIFRGAIGGGLAGAGWHAYKQNGGTLEGVKAAVGLAQKPKPLAVSAMGADPHAMVNRLNDSIERVRNSNRSRGLGEIHTAVSDMRQGLAGKTGDHVDRLHANINDLEDMARVGQTNGFLRSLKKLNIFDREMRQTPVFDNTLADRMHDIKNRLAELHNVG